MKKRKSFFTALLGFHHENSLCLNMIKHKKSESIIKVVYMKSRRKLINLLVKLSQAPAMSCTENSKFTAIPTGAVSSTESLS